MKLSSTAAYGIIAALSISSFALFESQGHTLILALAVFAIALVKIATILNGFMHLEWQHRPFAQVLTGWLVVVGAVLAGGMFALPWNS
ncbi:cytochrome C oxidase subunit IV family protein [Novosphingobium colocasiae]|uniref:cytochrome C oxidase subunit IV family protein n=1 Tax=Novosphingobium colocasiae TaxID=1256513 RepID=UPI0035B0020C